MILNKSVPTLLVVVVGLIIGAVFIYKNTQSNIDYTSSNNASVSEKSSPQAQVNVQNWSVYKSQDNVYQVGYPKEWSEQSSDGNFAVYSKYDSTKIGKVASAEDISFSVRLEKPPSQEGAGIFNKLYDQPDGSSESGWVKLQNMSIGGSPAIKLLHSPESGSGGINSLVYLVKRDSKYYYLTFSPFSDESWAKNSAVVTFMVESFKFLSTLNISPTQSL